MIPVSAVRLVDYVVIGISGLGFLLCLATAVYVVPWSKTRRKQEATKEFNLFWKSRLTLQIASAAWLLAQWLRLEAFWGPGSKIFPRHVTNWTGDGTLCRLYLCISLGLLEPFCLLTACLLCRMTLNKRRPQDAGWANSWVLGLALLFTVPVLAVQCVLAWLSTMFPTGFQWEREPHSVLHYFFAPYLVGTVQECDDSAGQTCALCMFPAASCIVALCLDAAVACHLWHTTRRMIAAVINRRLQRRLRAFQIATLSVLAWCAATRGATLSGSPFSWAFQSLWLAHFLSIPVLLAISSALLIVLPVYDSNRASKDAKEEAVCEEEEGEDGHDTVLLVTSDKSTPEKSDVPSR